MTARTTRKRKPRAQIKAQEPTQLEAQPQQENQSEVVQEKKDSPKIDKLFRKQQWDMLDTRARKVLGITEKQFLENEDVTGFGPNSYFTPREKREA